MPDARLARPAALLLMLLLPCLVGGCSDDDGDGDGGGDDAAGVTRTGDAVELGDPSSFLVRLSPQESDGTSVVVDEVVITGSTGFVAVYSDGDGAPGRLLGASDVLEAGSTTDVVVELDEPLEETAVLHAMVHLDDDGNGRLDFPAHDAPATDGTGIVVVAAEVSVD